MSYHYPGPFTPFKHQRATTEFIINTSRGWVFNEMGLGKSASALWAIDALMEKGAVKRCLIVAPQSTLTRVWADEAFRLVTHRQSVVLHGTAARRRQLFAGSWQIGIINFEGVPTLFSELREAVSDGSLDMIVIDEASAYRHVRTHRWKLMRELVRQVPRCIQMTGTPCPESPMDAYGLAKLLGVEGTPRHEGSWRRMVMQQVSRFKWVPKPEGYELAYRLLQPSIRFAKADCLDLPPLTEESRRVPLSREQASAYKQMQRQMQVEFERGDALNAVNAADRINKLRQIACGVVRDTATGEYLVLDHQPRVQEVEDVIEQAATKVIIVVPFKGIILALAERFRKRWSVGIINGDVPIGARDELISRFRSSPDPHVLLVHPQVMAHGLTLVEASTIVFFAPIYSAEQHKQVIERINRPGQKHKMTVVYLSATDLEDKIYSAVSKKMVSEDTLLLWCKQASMENV